VTGGGFHRRLRDASAPPAEPSSLAAGVKANFAVGGGVKNGAFWGHLEYVDHSMSPPMQVHGTSVTGYFLGPDTATDRVITGTAQINGTDGFTYMVEVSDIAEPGRGVDKFSIELSNGYKGRIHVQRRSHRGGNIQLHPHKPVQHAASGDYLPVSRSLAPSTHGTSFARSTEAGRTPQCNVYGWSTPSRPETPEGSNKEW